MPKIDRYRVPNTNLREVRGLLNNGVHVISSPTVYEASIEWLECEVETEEAAAAIKAMGGVKITSR